MKKLLSIVLCALLLAGLFVPGMAAGRFDDGAYASVLTGSDFQAYGAEAYERHLLPQSLKQLRDVFRRVAASHRA